MTDKSLDNMTLERLRGRLVVSCQPVPGSPMDTVEIIVAFALAALDGGAAGLRIEGVRNVQAVRKVTDAPLIGLVKRDIDKQERITPWLEDVEALAEAGADIIAFDATRRVRSCSVESLIAAVHTHDRIAMADCSDAEDGRLAFRAGADVLGSTLSGYVGGPVPDQPDYALLADLSAITSTVFAEGRYHRPEQAAQAMTHGAWAVVVGSAITRTEHVTTWFADAVRDSGEVT